MLQNTRYEIFFMALLLLCFCVLFPDIVCAASDADSGIIARIYNTYDSQKQKIIEVTTKYAKNLFYFCAVLEVCWLGVNAALGRADIGEIFKKFCITLVVCGFFLAVINNYYEWSRQVVNGLTNIAGEVANQEDASDLAFKKGLEVCNDMWEAMGPLKLWDHAATLLLWVFSLLVALIIFCLITARVIVYKCEAVIAMAASCILLGFGGSSVMREFAMSTLKYILAVGMKLFTMNLIIAVGFNQIKELVKGQPDVPLALVILACVIVLMVLVDTLPGIVAGLVSSSSGGTGAGLANMGRTALGAGAAVAGGAAMMAGAAMNSALAVKAARAGGAEGFKGTVGGAVKAMGSAFMEAKANRESTGGSEGNEPKPTSIFAALQNQVVANKAKKEAGNS